MIITIDGPTGSGKSSTARILAQKLGIYYLNSGALYRALAHLLTTHAGYTESTLHNPKPEDVIAYLNPARSCTPTHPKNLSVFFLTMLTSPHFYTVTQQ